jgi:uncharacterized membrane protein
MEKLEKIEKPMRYEPRKIIYYALWITVLCFIYGAVMTIFSYQTNSVYLCFHLALASISASLIFFIISIFYREQMLNVYQK